jgi:putative uncharacterized protein (fragment)
MEMGKDKGVFFAEGREEERRSLSPLTPSFSSANPSVSASCSSFSFLPFYSLFLSVLVIFVHSTHFPVTALQAVPNTGFFSTSFLIKIEYFFSEFLGQAAVPGFFFLSGFLFLKGLHSRNDWLRKEKSRVFSYLLPYLIWNTMMTLLYLSFGKAEWSLKTVAEGIFLYRFNPVFWYFYQLILLSFCFPFMAIFVLFIRKGEARKKYREKSLRYLIFLFPLFFLFLIYRQLDIPFLNEDAAFYYSLGGAVAFLWERRQCGVGVMSGAMSGVQFGVTSGAMSGLSAFSLFAFAVFCYRNTLLPHAIGILLLATVLYRISMALFILFLFLFLFRKMDCKRAEVRFNARKEEVQIEEARREGVQKEKVRKIGSAHGILSVLEGLSKMNFYIYAVHYLFLRLWFFLQNVMYASMEKNSTGFSGSGKEEAVKLLFYLLSPVYCLFLAYLTGKGLKKLSPCFWKALNGGRG